MTGVVGTLRAGNRSNRAIALRADMDALAMDELNEFEHASTHDGKMHGCGHDGHTTMLLGAARHLAKARNLMAPSILCFSRPRKGLVVPKR